MSLPFSFSSTFSSRANLSSSFQKMSVRTCYEALITEPGRAKSITMQECEGQLTFIAFHTVEASGFIDVSPAELTSTRGRTPHPLHLKAPAPELGMGLGSLCQTSHPCTQNTSRGPGVRTNRTQLGTGWDRGIKIYLHASWQDRSCLSTNWKGVSAQERKLTLLFFFFNRTINF